MTGTAHNSVAYAGIVTLSQQVKSKKFTIAKIHNEGGISLFNFLADCLTGDFSNVNINRPMQIMLLHKDGDSYQKANNVSTFSQLLSAPERVYSETEGIVRYSFIIPYESLANTNFNAIGLYPLSASVDELENFSACCEVNLDSISNKLSKSSVLAVDWELHIFNPSAAKS
jgi:hypothetical protein